jgi:hypothetical protein
MNGPSFIGKSKDRHVTINENVKNTHNRKWSLGECFIFVAEAQTTTGRVLPAIGRSRPVEQPWLSAKYELSAPAIAV